MIEQSRCAQISEQQAKSRVAFLEAHLLRPFLKDLENLGKTDRAQKLADQLSGELQVYERVLLSSATGQSIASIARVEGIPERTLQRWISEGGLPGGLSNRSQSNRKAREKPISIPRQPSPDFASFMGSFCAFTRPGTVQYHIRPRVASRSIAERIARGFTVAVPSGASIYEYDQSKDKTPFEVNCLQLRLSRHCNVITAANTRIPWEHLQTEQERVGFLQGFFDVLGSFNMNEPGSFTVQKLNGASLLTEVAQVMASLGVVPKIQLGARPTLFVNEKRSLQRMHALNLLLEDSPAEKLQQIAFRPVTRVSYTAEQYYRSKTLWELQPELNNSEVSRVVDIPADQIRSWRTRGRRPNEIDRIEELEKLVPLQPEQHSMIAKLFRTCGLPSEFVRRIVVEFPIDAIEDKLNQIECRGIDLRDSPELLYTLLHDDSAVERVKPVDSKEKTPVFSDSIFDMQQQTVLEGVRAQIEKEDLSRHPYLEPLLDLCKVSPSLSFPAFTYEKFVGDLAEQDRQIARLVLLALSTRGIQKLYWHHLVEEELVPDALEVSQ